MKEPSEQHKSLSLLLKGAPECSVSVAVVLEESFQSIILV